MTQRPRIRDRYGLIMYCSVVKMRTLSSERLWWLKKMCYFYETVLIATDSSDHFAGAKLKPPNRCGPSLLHFRRQQTGSHHALEITKVSKIQHQLSAALFQGHSWAYWTESLYDYEREVNKRRVEVDVASENVRCTGSSTSKTSCSYSEGCLFTRLACRGVEWSQSYRFIYT